MNRYPGQLGLLRRSPFVCSEHVRVLGNGLSFNVVRILPDGEDCDFAQAVERNDVEFRPRRRKLNLCFKIY